MAIPRELREKRQWTHSFSTKELKRPAYTEYKPDGALNYIDAKDIAGDDKYIGFYVTLKDRYVLIDVDHTEHDTDLPANLSNLVTVFNPTYCEVSPSGKGLRIIYKLEKSEDKLDLSGNSFFAKEIFKKNKRNVQLNIGPPWMTITGDETSYSVERIADLPLEVLDGIFNIKRKRTEDATPTVQIQLPSFTAIKNSLFNIPLNQNPRIIRAYEQLTGSEYHHYDFWLRILMSLHDYAFKAGKLVECFDLGLMWSKTDSEAFKNDEDVKRKWDSFSNKDASVTFNTLFKINKLCTIWWPDPAKDAKKRMEKGLPVLPFARSISNYKTLFKFYDLKFHRDEGDPNLFYVTADQDILDKYFTKGTEKIYFDKYIGPYSTRSFSRMSLQFFMDNYVVGMSSQIIREFTDHAFASTTRTVNLFKIYYTTPFEEIPESYKVNALNYENSTFENLWSCIKLKDNISKEQIALCKIFYLKWLYNLLRNQVLPPSQYNNNIGILLLTGDEQVRKTSHFKCILPKAFRYKIVFTSHGFKNEADLRDTAKISAFTMVVVWDEIEQFLNPETEANFKKTLDANPQTFIDKYETVAATYKPISIYGATSNQSKFKLSRRTNRRLLNIPVKWVDTDKMNTLCWHPILHDVEATMKNKDWLLTDTELEIQAKYHEAIKSKTDLDIIIREIFNFETAFDILDFKHFSVGKLIENKRLMSLKTIVNILELKGVYFKRPALKNSLIRACAFYTGTQHKSKLYKSFYVKDGIVKYGTQVLFVMPNIQTDDDDVFD